MSILSEVDLGEEAEFSSPLQMTELFSKYNEVKAIELVEIDTNMP